MDVETKTCSKCGVTQPRDQFPPKHGRVCRRCRAIIQKAYREGTQNSDCKKYEKTPNGFLMRAYRNMKSRVTGVQWKKAHLYEGLSILPKEEFYVWAKGNPDFWRLYRTWVLTGYNRKLSPSVNRVDPDRGYEIDNIEWLTHSVNSGLARTATQRSLERVYALTA